MHMQNHLLLYNSVYNEVTLRRLVWHWLSNQPIVDIMLPLNCLEEKDLYTQVAQHIS